MRVHSLPGRAWLMLLMLNAACNSPLDAPQPSEASDTPVRGGTLRTAHQDDLRSLDPAALGDGLAPEIVNLIYAGLVDYGQDGLVKPDLAERFETLEDGLLYRFYLRKDARFQDGEALMATDVKRSMPSRPPIARRAFTRASKVSKPSRPARPHRSQACKLLRRTCSIFVCTSATQRFYPSSRCST
jgi:hypothetical protein